MAPEIRRHRSRLDALEIGWGDPCRAKDVIGHEPEVITSDDDLAREALVGRDRRESRTDLGSMPGGGGRSASHRPAQHQTATGLT